MSQPDDRANRSSHNNNDDDDRWLEYDADDGGEGEHVGGDFEKREDVYKGKQSHYEQQRVNDRNHFSYVHCREEGLGFASQTIEGVPVDCHCGYVNAKEWHWTAISIFAMFK